MTARSGADLGAENVARLQTYLDGLAAKGDMLPMRAGRPNFSAVAIACGFDRQVLYKNPGASALLECYVADHVGSCDPEQAVEEPDAKPKSDRRDKRIQQLEQQLAAARAECVGLREKLRRLQHIEDHMVETGRRIISLPSSLGEIGKP